VSNEAQKVIFNIFQLKFYEVRNEDRDNKNFEKNEKEYAKIRCFIDYINTEEFKRKTVSLIPVVIHLVSPLRSMLRFFGVSANENPLTKSRCIDGLKKENDKNELLIEQIKKKIDG
jgi:hypothetical protein